MCGVETNEALEVVHSAGYGLGGTMPRGGPWRVTIYTLSHGAPVCELPSVATWDEAVLAAAEWVSESSG